MQNFVYKKSNKSGIGDRLIDIILVYTYCKYLNCNKLFLHWYEGDELIGNGNDIYSQARIKKTPNRKYDYLLKNFNKFVELPNDIIFVTIYQLNKLADDKTNNIFFDEYLGVRYTVYEFIKHYEIKDKKTFENMYFENFKKITFKNIPDEIINIFNVDNIITIHLRRGDKVVNDNGITNNITYYDLENLDNKTEKYITNLIDKNIKVCIVSDEKDKRDEYLNKFKNLLYFDGDNVSQTYIDLFCLSKSSEILLSQKFSSFSILACLINCSKLNYILDGEIINKFSKYKNIQKINL